MTDPRVSERDLLDLIAVEIDRWYNMTQTAAETMANISKLLDAARGSVDNLGSGEPA